MKALVAAMAVAALSACAPEGDRTAEPASPAGGSSLAEINAQPVVAPSGSAQLTPLAASARGDAGCAFAYQGRALLVTRDAQSAAGAAVIDGREIALDRVGDRAGPSPVLAGDGYTVTVRATSGSTADLVVTGPEGDTVFPGGSWSCGQ